MDCCIGSWYDGEIAGFHREEIKTARKKHTCFECGRTIEPGEKYEYVIGKWDGVFQVYKTCNDCLSARDTLFCGEYTYGMVWEDIRYFLDSCCYDDTLIPWSAIGIMTPRARNMILEMIEDKWDKEGLQ